MPREKLKYVDTPKYPGVGLTAIDVIERRLKKVGYEFKGFINGGTFGKVFYTNKPGVVCKITKSETEAYVSQTIFDKNNDLKSLPKVYSVFRTEIKNQVYFIILMQELFPDKTLEKFLNTDITSEVEWIFDNSTIKPKLVVDIEMFIQCYALKENIRVANLPSKETEKFYTALKNLKDWEVKELITYIRQAIDVNPYYSEQFQNIIESVDFLKSNNISYADIAWRNLMVDSDKNIKIIDFGYSYISGDDIVEVDALD